VTAFDSRRNICSTGTLHVNGCCQMPSLRLYFKLNQPAVTPVFGSVISLDRFESISVFLHFIETSKDTNQGPQTPFKSIL